LGRPKSKLKKEGQLIGPIDLLLAAQALNRGLIFVTNNIKEFERIENLNLENRAEAIQKKESFACVKRT